MAWGTPRLLASMRLASPKPERVFVFLNIQTQRPTSQQEAAKLVTVQSLSAKFPNQVLEQHGWGARSSSDATLWALAVSEQNGIQRGPDELLRSAENTPADLSLVNASPYMTEWDLCENTAGIHPMVNETKNAGRSLKWEPPAAGELGDPFAPNQPSAKPPASIATPDGALQFCLEQVQFIGCLRWPGNSGGRPRYVDQPHFTVYKLTTPLSNLSPQPLLVQVVAGEPQVDSTGVTPADYHSAHFARCLGNTPSRQMQHRLHAFSVTLDLPAAPEDAQVNYATLKATQQPGSKLWEERHLITNVFGREDQKLEGFHEFSYPTHYEEGCPKYFETRNIGFVINLNWENGKPLCHWEHIRADRMTKSSEIDDPLAMVPLCATTMATQAIPFPSVLTRVPDVKMIRSPEQPEPLENTTVFYFEAE